MSQSSAGGAAYPGHSRSKTTPESLKLSGSGVGSSAGAAAVANMGKVSTFFSSFFFSSLSLLFNVPNNLLLSCIELV